MSDERTRFEVLLEEVRSQFGVLADGHLSLRQSIDVLSAGHLSLRQLIDENHAQLSGKIDGVAEELTEFRVTTNGRLTRIEHHLGLNGTPKPAKRAPAKRPPAPKSKSKSKSK